MDHKGQVLWDPTSCNSNNRPRLRQPRGAPTAETTNSNDEAAAVPEISKTSVLRADAPEFVPRPRPNVPTDDLEQQFTNVHISLDNDSNLQYGRHSAQSRLNKIKSSGTPGNESQVGGTSSCYNNVQPEMYVCSSSNDADIARLKQIISSLMKYPGQFDNLLMVFMETICPHFDNIITMSEIVQILVSQGINCPNFRYNGVRLCWFVEQRCPEFRAELHLRCQKELQENANQQNVLLFVAELYTQLPHDSLYGAKLIESMKKLLSAGGNDNIKCVCQALKLTGYSLEQTRKQALDDIFKQLKESMNSSSDSMLSFINSVINLRESNWGRSSTESSNNSTDSSEYDQDYEEMVNDILYEVDGQTLSNEQQEFLAVHANDYEADDGEVYDEMDDEMEEAFEEFLKLSKG